MPVTMNNGRTRKTLAEQLDRLDRILDVLGDGLNEAVASAVKEAAGAAVQEAVRQALVEVLTNPDVLALIGGAARAQAAAPVADDAPAAARPALRDRLGALSDWAGRQVRAARSACARAASAARGCLGGLAARLSPLWRLRRQLLVALGVGAAAGLLAYFGAPWVAGMLSGLAAFGAALSVQAGLWLRRLFAGAAAGATT